MHSTARASPEIAQEKVLAVTCRQANARVIGQTGWAVPNVGDRRQTPCHLRIRITHAFGYPRAACVRGRNELPANAPSAVPTLDRVHPARRVAAVGIVVASPKVPILIEGELLRVAQPLMHDFKGRTVGIAPVNRAGL